MQSLDSANAEPFYSLFFSTKKDGKVEKLCFSDVMTVFACFRVFAGHYLSAMGYIQVGSFCLLMYVSLR